MRINPLMARLRNCLARPIQRARQSRRGTVIIVVLALLGLLVFIGFFIFAFTSQENQSATYFAAAAKNNAATATNADVFFNDVLRQIIIGPSINEQQSALWGGNKSLLPTMFGRDMTTFNGQGINWIWNTTTNLPTVDQNYDNVPDDGTGVQPNNLALLQLNLSPAAQAGTLLDLNNFPAAGALYPDPDTNTTYPDLNSAFLSYDALIPNPANPALLTRVIIPSFHRPQLLRNANSSPGPGSVTPATWYIDPGTVNLVMYPHTEHVVINNSGVATATRRFVTGTHPDTTTPALYPFSIPGDIANPALTPPYLGQPAPVEGVWTNPAGGVFNYAVDTDNDGVLDANYIDFGFPLMTTPDGTQQYVAMAAVRIIDADALYNLNVHGNRAGQAAVPSANNFGGLSTFLSRSNLGVSASEVNPQWAFNARPVAGGSDFPGTPAALASALQQYASFFRAPANSGTLPANNFDPTAGAITYELANMEWWNILNGRPQLTPSASPTTIAATVSGSSLPGRWGENSTRLDPNVAQVLAGNPVSAGLGTAGGDPWPLPGTSGVDDNNNFAESGTFTDELGILHPAFVTPLDFFGSGSWFTGTEGKQRLLLNAPNPPAPGGEQMFPQYANYFTNASVLWTTFFNPGGSLMSGGGGQLLIDEPDETFTEPSAAATQPNDNIYGPSENLGQLSGTDFTALGNPTRTASLASFSMASNARAAQIRQRFTSSSWDLKSFGKEFLGPYAAVNDARRLWEFSDISGGAGTGPFRFPPNFGTLPVIQPAPMTGATALAYSNYPLRPDVAHLLWTLADPKQQQTTNALLLPQHPLSINGLTEQTQTGTDSSGNPIYTFSIRPLMPHPTATSPPATLPNTPITVPGHSSDGIGYLINRPVPGLNVQQQEWLARYDRQRLARDIYTLLYLTGGGSDTFNYATTSNQPVAGVRPLYTDDQLQEMAQFAVNLVDQLDTDSNITIFEYDKDLSNGWNLDDNAYDGLADTQPPFNIVPADRGVVYGVERQQLAFNEAMVVFSQQAVNSTPPIIPIRTDHPDTQWDDKKQWAALYLELDNIGPTNVSFNNEQWEIAIKQSPIVQPQSTFYGTERRLIFQSSQPLLVPGAASALGKPRLTIGGLIGSTAGATWDQVNDTVSGNPTMPNPSYLVVDPNDLTGTPTNTGFDNQFPIVPRAAYVSPTAPPFGMATALDLDLTQPGTENQFWVVPPNPADPTGNADGAPSLITTPAGLSPGTQLLNFTDPITEPTGTISQVPGAHIFPETALIVRLELKRRVDPNRAPILPTDTNVVTETTDNPWVVVDYMDVPVSVLALKITGAATDFAPQIQYQLGSTTNPGGVYHQYIPTGGAAPLVSTERSQPLYHDFKLNPFNPTGTVNATTPNGPYIIASSNVYPRNGGATTLKASVWQGNSLGQDNDAAGFDPGTVSGTLTPAPAHPMYQPHYDRDFASIIELFNVPTWGPYGPASLTTMNVPGVSSGNTVALSSGLTHLMGTRTNEAGTVLAGGFTPEVLGGTDFVPNDSTVAPRQHYNGYGIAGYRFQHPEGGGLTPPNPVTDVTENRWHRLFGLVEVPTRSHRELEEPPYQITAGTINGSPGFYRTPGKINLNTVRHPDVLAGLLDESDIYALSYSAPFPAGQNFQAGLSVPLSLLDQNGDTVSVPATATRDWWLQFITARDGIDPLPTANGGTNLPLPGLPRYPSGTSTTVPLPWATTFSTGAAVPPGSHPFRGAGFSAYANAPLSTTGGEDQYGYNNTVDSNILRALTGDQVTIPATAAPANTPDGRRRIFEVGIFNGTENDHLNDMVDYATKNRVLSKILQNTTTRSNVFFVWIQVDFFQAKDVNPPNGEVRIGAKLATSPAYRGFFVIDRSQALSLMQSQFLPAVDPTTHKFVFSFNQSFNYQSLVTFRQRIQ
jgi:hypothetical protein